MELIKMTNEDAKKFFMCGENYCTIPLPNYFYFEDLLKNAETFFSTHPEFSSFKSAGNQINDCIITMNKGSDYQWRKLRIINPILYVDLVNLITKKDNWEFIQQVLCSRINSNIICCSMPKKNDKKKYMESSINNWWERFEQEIITQASFYNFMAISDISNCYSSIYTHTIAWALHGKENAKKYRNDTNLLGNAIDKHLQIMSNGQTNGIPEGSVLMDFIAEILLSYADKMIYEDLETLKIKDYKILRYRDDYRIFSNNETELSLILQRISFILSDLNLKINSQKTKVVDNILYNAIKPDKLYLLSHKISRKSLQTQLYAIWKLANDFPDSGQVCKELQNIYYYILKLKNEPENSNQLISIIINIMLLSSKYYPLCMSLLSIFATFNDKYNYIKNCVDSKFQNVPNNDLLEIWEQRLTLPFEQNVSYNSILCQKVLDGNVKLCNYDWCFESFKEKIIDKEKIKKLKKIITKEEVQLFIKDY